MYLNLFTYVKFLESKGMGISQTHLINFCFMVTLMFMEVPTGAFADFFGRKKSVVASFFVCSLGALVYFRADSFMLFVLAEIIIAIGRAFYSGAMQAWMVDNLNANNCQNEIQQAIRRGCYLRQIGTAVGGLAGGLIGEENLGLPWLVTAAALLASGIICWRKIPEIDPDNGQKTQILRRLQEKVTAGVKNGWRDRSVMSIFAFSGIAAFTFQPLNMQWPLLFTNEFNWNISFLGWVVVGINVFLAIGGFFSTWFSQRIKNDKRAVILSQAITVAGMLGASMMFEWGSVLSGFLIHEIGRGMLEPLKDTFINHRISGEQRATILSFGSMIVNVGAAAGLLVTGYIAESYSISAAWLLSGSLLAVSIPFFLSKRTKKE